MRVEEAGGSGSGSNLALHVARDREERKESATDGTEKKKNGLEGGEPRRTVRRGSLCRFCRTRRGSRDT